MLSPRLRRGLDYTVPLWQSAVAAVLWCCASQPCSATAAPNGMLSFASADASADSALERLHRRLDKEVAFEKKVDKRNVQPGAPRCIAA